MNDEKVNEMKRKKNNFIIKSQKAKKVWIQNDFAYLLSNPLAYAYTTLELVL